MKGCKGRGQPYCYGKGKAAGEGEPYQIFLKEAWIPERTGGGDGKR